MGRKLTCFLLACALSAQPTLRAQQPTDAEVAKGIKQVEDGDLSEAILTLDAAVRRLSSDPSRARDLGRAYLYLGIAYLGKGQETLARAKFREAVQQVRELSLSPDQYSPKVIELLEAAKKEAATAAQGPRAPSPPAAAPTPPEPKRRSKLPVVLGGAAVLAGAVVLAAGGGKSGEPDLTRFYGTYPNLMFATQTSGCAPFTATLELSGNPDGSNFQINKTFPPASNFPPIRFTGGIQGTGHFTGTGGGFSITGQSTGNRIAGSDTRQSGGPACTWMFDGTR